MSPPIDIRPGDLRTVRRVLAGVLPDSARIWVFGSRAVGEARRASDLDLAIDAGRRIEPREAAALSEAFDASDLPYSVDVVDMRAVSATFAAIICERRVPLPEIGAAS